MNYKKIAILGDLHIRTKSPYFQSSKKVLNWILDNNEINNENTLIISGGDLFDTELNNGELNELLHSFFDNLKNKEKIITTGNHDTSKENGNALQVLSNIKGMTIIEEPTNMLIDGLHFLFLPHIFSNKEGITMEDRYSNLHLEDAFKDQKFDYCIAHLMDETRQFHKKSKVCDLSNLDIKKKVFSHDHNYNLDKGGNYLGSLQPNSSTETDKEPKIYIIDLEKGEDYTIDVPLFINYFNVKYPNPLPKKCEEVDYPIINIIDSLDKAESTKYYKDLAKDKGIDLHINRVFRKKLMNDKEEVKSEKGKEYKSDLDYYNTLETEKGFTKGVSTIVRRMLKK